MPDRRGDEGVLVTELGSANLERAFDLGERLLRLVSVVPEPREILAHMRLLQVRLAVDLVSNRPRALQELHGLINVALLLEIARLR